MCELFCLSSRRPTRATFSLKQFAAHGAPDGRNVDGWGVAFHDGREARLYKSRNRRATAHGWSSSSGVRCRRAY